MNCLDAANVPHCLDELDNVYEDIEDILEEYSLQAYDLGSILFC